MTTSRAVFSQTAQEREEVKTYLVAWKRTNLDDPPGQFHGDYSDPSPSTFAAQALNQIVFGKYSVGWTPQQWKAWANTNFRKYVILKIR